MLFKSSKGILASMRLLLAMANILLSSLNNRGLFNSCL